MSLKDVAGKAKNEAKAPSAKAPTAAEKRAAAEAAAAAAAEAAAAAAEAAAAADDEVAREDQPVADDGSDVLDTEKEEITPEPAAPVAERAETAVVPAKSNAPAVVGAMGSAMDSLHEQGFDGITIGRGSFPQVVLKELFSTTDGIELGTSFTGHMLGSVAKFIVKNDQDDDDEEFFYCPESPLKNPDVLSSGGKRAYDIIDEWEKNGWKWIVKPYMDVMFQIIDANGTLEEGDLVLLQIPETSIPRISGVLAMMTMKKKIPAETVVKVERGNKVTGVAHPFYPWQMKIVG